MEISLENIELVVDRTGATYKEAKDALEKSKGSALDAIIYLEDTIEVPKKDKLAKDRAKSVLDNIVHFIKQGNVIRVKVSNKDDEILLNIPINALIPGVVGAPVVAIGYIVAIFATHCKIELLLKNGNTINFTENTIRTARGFYEKGKEFRDAAANKMKTGFENVKEKASEVKETVDITTEPIREKAMKKGEEIKEKVAPTVNKAKEKVGPTVSKAKEKAGETIDNVKEMVQEKFATKSE